MMIIRASDQNVREKRIFQNFRRTFYDDVITEIFKIKRVANDKIKSKAIDLRLSLTSFFKLFTVK